MEFIVAFVMIFVSGDQGGKGITTGIHAQRTRQAEFPGGKIRRTFPVVITFMNGSYTVTEYVWECLRPVMDKDKGKKSTPKPESNPVEKLVCIAPGTSSSCRNYLWILSSDKSSHKFKIY